MSATVVPLGELLFCRRWAAYAEIKFILLNLTLTLTPTTDPPKRFPYYIPFVCLRQKTPRSLLSQVGRASIRLSRCCTCKQSPQPKKADNLSTA